tara:strand:- start:138 stop:350 length:213 start_codon:yes stop_codon:yes gene_type:complete
LEVNFNFKLKKIKISSKNYLIRLQWLEKKLKDFRTQNEILSSHFNFYPKDFQPLLAGVTFLVILLINYIK